jgi:hypothetical protein
MIVKTLPDITPNGVATPLVVASPNITVPARWIQLSTTGTTCRYGDSNVGASRGARISSTAPAQIGFGFQEGQGPYDLTQIYIFATGADSVSITFGV